MAANLFGRYVWLIDTLRRYKRLTFQEINELWQESGLSYGEELPLRTFHNHQKAIKDIFDVYIDCDRKDGYRYYIDEPERLEGNNLRSWLISSYATLNQIQADKKLEDRIIFEDIPSGQTWLTPIAEAMRRSHVLNIKHQGFGKPEVSTFEIEPYCLKVVKRRWYVVARSPYYSEQNKEKGIKPVDVYRVYALDRISDIQDTGKIFKMKKNFDINQYFEGCCGVITSDAPIQRIVLLAYGGFADYLRTLPLHESQREIEGDDESTLFEYHLKPTFDFYQLVLAQGEQVEVLEPESVRNEMCNFAKKHVGLLHLEGGETMQGINFIAIDFETATGKRASICEAGICVVRDGKVAETRSWLVRPQGNMYSYWNMQIHGIRPNDTANSPGFPEEWTEISEYLKDIPVLVAHNATFDIGCIRHSLELYKVR